MIWRCKKHGPPGATALGQFPGEPPHCHSCREGAGAHQHAPHSWVLPHCKAIKNHGNFRTWAAPPAQHCWRRYIWSWFVDFPWECFRIERRWGNFWKMEFTVLVGVFCRHVNVSLGSKAATVSLLRVRPGLTCWWPNSQIVSEGEAKSWH